MLLSIRKLLVLSLIADGTKRKTRQTSKLAFLNHNFVDTRFRSFFLILIVMIAKQIKSRTGMQTYGTE